jgi:DNA-binding transcriptional MocR family regulator
VKLNEDCFWCACNNKLEMDLAAMSQDLEHWTKYIGESEKPAYLAIVDAITHDIQNGRLRATQRLPPLRNLAHSLGLNYTTVARGYGEAQRRGLIDAQAGRGTFVRAMSPSTAARSLGFVGPAEMTMNLPPEPRNAVLMDRIGNGFTQLRDQLDVYSLLRYQEFGGTDEDRSAGIRWLASRIPKLATERVLVCPGIQSALLALMSMLLQPGEIMCTEALTYPGVKAIAAQLGIRLLGLRVDADGIDPQAFAEACLAHRPKVLYCNPTLLNPTTATISEARRGALAALAREHGVTIIEDDAYGHLPSKTPSTIAALAPEITFHLTGLAKSFGAGLRVAYLVSPDARQSKRVAAVLRATAVMASPITLALATRWINDGTADAMVEEIRRESRARQKIASQVLPEETYQSHSEAFHLWLTLPPPWTRIEFSTQLRTRGIGIVNSDAFAVSSHPPEAVRVCLGGAANREDTRRALEIIADTLEQLPAVASTVV